MKILSSNFLSAFIKIFCIFMFAINAVGCIAVYKSQQVRNDLCNTENCTITFASTGKKPFLNNQKSITLNTSVTTKETVLNTFGKPSKVVYDEDGIHETWRYNNGVFLNGVLLMVIMPIPLVVPYGYNYTAYRFKYDILEYIGEVKEDGKFIWFCYAPIWGNCLKN
jgi:hypothetical protein